MNIKELWTYVINQLSTVELTDIIDILIVTFILYYAYKFMRDRRAGKLSIGILIIVGVLIASNLLKLGAVKFLLENFFQVGLIALIIVFQPELGSMLEKIGNSSLKNFNRSNDTEVYVTEVCNAVETLSKDKTGALIVIERNTKLGDHTRVGTVLDADISSSLINTIFFPNTPLHDGAVIIRDGRLYMAGCFLPLSQTSEINKNLGTRHRAALGVSENSDALVIIVSEETGTISVAFDGILRRGFTKKTLETYIYGVLHKERTVSSIAKKGERFFSKKGGDNDGEK